ncbi:hypothetical protein [Paenibacillus sp. FSL R7-0333]|uniref:hypothetical protein n=1 Tax=Paenibacillus sp. FSL R7-0333 TaxID=1926587 RepID=UPI00096C3B50|nr:hypothetical protein BK146_32350 [Paenibacillus sp. FSL R7-0333]
MEKLYGSVKIKSAWFDQNNKKRKILDIDYKGLNMYLTLCKYRLKRENLNEEFIFYTTISELRHTSGYSADETIDLLKLLITKKIIKLQKPTRWDRLKDENNKIKVNEMIVFRAIDVPQTDSVIKEGKRKDQPRSDEDLWISVDLDMLEFYKGKGLSDKYYPLHCLLSKLSNGQEQKAFMTITKMAKTLGTHQDTIHKYIKVMNEKNVVCSFFRNNGKGGKKLEHKICKGVGTYAEFLEINKDTMDRNTERWKSRGVRNIGFNGEDDDGLDFEEGAFEEVESDEFEISSLPLGTGFVEHEAVYH